MSYQRIIAAIDPESPVLAVLQCAAQLADRAHGELAVVAALPHLEALYDRIDPGLRKRFEKELVANARDQLADAARDARIRQPDLRIVRGDADEAIAELADAQRADLVVFGNHDRHGLDHFVGGFGLGLLYRAACDLLAVNPLNPVPGLERPLVALADEDSDGHVLARARNSFGGELLQAVHVIRAGWADQFSGGGASASEQEVAEAQVRQRAAARLQRHQPCELQVRFGKPSEEIDAAAREGGHGLIAMGSGRHSRLGWHLGSTAHNLLSLTQRNVLLVRPRSRRA